MKTAANNTNDLRTLYEDACTALRKAERRWYTCPEEEVGERWSELRKARRVVREAYNALVSA